MPFGNNTASPFSIPSKPLFGGTSTTLTAPAASSEATKKDLWGKIVAPKQTKEKENAFTAVFGGAKAPVFFGTPADVNAEVKPAAVTASSYPPMSSKVAPKPFSNTAKAETKPAATCRFTISTKFKDRSQAVLFCRGSYT